jgi:hypothetical protein
MYVRSFESSNPPCSSEDLDDIRLHSSTPLSLVIRSGLAIRRRATKKQKEKNELMNRGIGNNCEGRGKGQLRTNERASKKRSWRTVGGDYTDGIRDFRPSWQSGGVWRRRQGSQRRDTYDTSRDREGEQNKTEEKNRTPHWRTYTRGQPANNTSGLVVGHSKDRIGTRTASGA